MVPLLIPSTLSMATEGVRNEIAAHFGNDVRVIVDMPARAEEMIVDDTPIINLFFYRILPSGFHAASSSNDPLMLRLHCLITPFSKDSNEPLTGAEVTSTNPAGEINLQILGRVIALFHENPVIGPLPPADQNPDGTIYSLESILRAPDMEEINHVWMTQGSDLPYRTSAAYEFSLVPVDPSEIPAPDKLITGYAGDLQPNMKNKDLPFNEASDELIQNELVIRFVDNGIQKEFLDQGGIDPPKVFVLIAGQKGETVRLVGTVKEEVPIDGVPTEVDVVVYDEEFSVNTDHIDDPNMENLANLLIDDGDQEITIRAEYLVFGDPPVPIVPPSNPLIILNGEIG